MAIKTFTNIAVLLEAFFSDYLMTQRQVSAHTIASYRDTFRLLLAYAQEKLHKAPAALCIDDLDCAFIRTFLNYLETKRGTCARTRNQRLAALRSCFRYATLYIPEKSHLIAQVLAIPSKRYNRALIDFLTQEESEALIAAPNQSTPSGTRDHALIMLALQTGLRVSELRNLRRRDVRLGAGPHVRCFGKGRKERCTPLTRRVVDVLKSWLNRCPMEDDSFVFTNAVGKPLSTDGIQYILARHAARAQTTCPSLAHKKITPHVLRHTTAMQLLHAGVDRTVIALWLGHESLDTTLVYLEADMKMKEQALGKVPARDTKLPRFHPTDQLLSFLNSL